MKEPILVFFFRAEKSGKSSVIFPLGKLVGEWCMSISLASRGVFRRGEKDPKFAVVALVADSEGHLSTFPHVQSKGKSGQHDNSNNGGTGHGGYTI